MTKLHHLGLGAVLLAVIATVGCANERRTVRHERETVYPAQPAPRVIVPDDTTVIERRRYERQIEEDD